MQKKRKVLVVGSTGYLGKSLVKELKTQGYWVRALGRNARKLEPISQYIDDMVIGEATRPETLNGVCKEIDIVVSSLGITRQKDGLTYMEVDYQANKNVLDEALIDNVGKFMYVSVFNAEKLRHLEIVKAKEKFVQALREADIEHVIVRPNGFFSDMAETLKMAERGRVYLFGNGEYRGNPIHGADLARACVERLSRGGGELDIGGPEILTQNEIARLAFEALKKEVKTTCIPLWIKNLALQLARTFTSSKTYGPIEFFLTVLTMDMVAPTYGQYTLKTYFKTLAESSRN